MPRPRKPAGPFDGTEWGATGVLRPLAATDPSQGEHKALRGFCAGIPAVDLENKPKPRRKRRTR
jgi:hypothetical protein